MVEITVSDMRARGKNGFVAKILDNGDRTFLQASEYSKHGSSHKELTFRLEEDGLYQVQDANFGSSRINRYYLKLKDGSVIAEADSLSELLLEDLELPELEGSTAQIKWAEDIRGKFISKKLMKGEEVSSQIMEEASAKYFIDNRELFAN